MSHKTLRRFHGYDYSRGERRVLKALAASPEVPMVRLSPTYMELAYRPHGDEPLLFAKKRCLTKNVTARYIRV